MIIYTDDMRQRRTKELNSDPIKNTIEANDVIRVTAELLPPAKGSDNWRKKQSATINPNRREVHTNNCVKQEEIINPDHLSEVAKMQHPTSMICVKKKEIIHLKYQK